MDDETVRRVVLELNQLARWFLARGYEGEVARNQLKLNQLRRQVMADKYIIRDKGYEIVNQTTGEYMATDEGRTWVNVGYEGVVALQKIWVDSIHAQQKLGEASIALKKKEGK